MNSIPLTSQDFNSISRVKQFVSDNYFKALYEVFGDKFIEYRKRWNSSLEGDISSLEKGPIQIDLELSNSCNYRCSFCPYSIDEAQWPDGFASDKNLIWMPYELAQRALLEARNTGAVAVELGYNTEPLMYPHLIDLIKYAREIGYIDIRMGTNASLLKPSIADSLVLSGLTQLQVSIDATDSDSYKLARNSNLYEKVISNIDYFLEKRAEYGQKLPVLRVTYILTPENKPNADKFLELWTDKADIVALQDLFVFENVNEQMREENNTLSSTSIAQNNDSELESCYMPKVRLSIKSDGKVHPCCTVPGMSIDVGDLKTSSILDVWHSNAMASIRNSHVDGTWPKYKTCNDCMKNVQ